jgi:hypothetical protein
MKKWPNKPESANPAIASQLHFGHHWHRVADPERWAATRIISALVKFDTKPRCMFSSTAKLLCHGTNEQIRADTNSQDPDVARAAQTMLRYPAQYKLYMDMYRKQPETVEPGSAAYGASRLVVGSLAASWKRV